MCTAIAAALALLLSSVSAVEFGANMATTSAQVTASPRVNDFSRGISSPEWKAVFPNRVASFNVCNPCRVSNPLHHIDQIVDEIVKYRPQAIALEEICVGETLRVIRQLRARGYRYYAAHGNQMNTRWGCNDFGSAYGSAILSAAPLTNKVNRHYSQGGSEPRGYVAANTTVAGRKVRVFATHLAQAGQDNVRKVQIGELIKAARAYPQVIVLGDFNAEPNASEMSPMWSKFHDADPACSPTRYLRPCKMTEDSRRPGGKKFDYIFLRNGGAFSSSGVGVHKNFSDHKLIHADLATN
ncbi:endonuclease/exonuclease/phosphatase family protein [Streptomyces sp. NPDC000941]